MLSHIRKIYATLTIIDFRFFLFELDNFYHLKKFHRYKFNRYDFITKTILM